MAVSELSAQRTDQPTDSPRNQAIATGPAGVAPIEASQQVGCKLVWIALPLAALTTLLFWDTFVQLRRVWDQDPSYSHGYLVPLASLGFAWLAWKRGRPNLNEALTFRGTTAGSLEIVLGMAIHAGAWLLSTLFLDVLALICVIRGLMLLVGGPSVNQKFGFAALFLIFMAPLPPSIYQAAALSMQHFVSVISTACLETMGIAAYRQGYMIYLSDYTMEVGEACSGLRQLTAIVALGVAIGELYQSSRPVRWTLAFIALPVAVGANCLRVTLSGVIMVFFGSQWAQGVFHTLEGLATILLAAAALVAIAGLLSRWERRGRESTKSRPEKPQPVEALA